MSGFAITVEKNVAALPLLLSLQQEGVGGIAGKSPTVRVRKGSTVDSYLDFTDNVFKTAGWGARDATMTEIGDGHYQRPLNISLLDVHKNDGWWLSTM